MKEKLLQVLGQVLGIIISFIVGVMVDLIFIQIYLLINPIEIDPEGYGRASIYTFGFVFLFLPAFILTRLLLRKYLPNFVGTSEKDIKSF